MLDSRIVEVAVGLVLVYLVFSLACSAINEWIARFFALRATGLRRGINELLADSDETGLAALFHQHALVAVLKPDKLPVLRQVFRTSDKANYPSYIPASTFATALMDLAMNVAPPAAGALAGTATQACDKESESQRGLAIAPKGRGR